MFILVRWNKYPKEQRGERNCQFIVVTTAIVITVRLPNKTSGLLARPGSLINPCLVLRRSCSRRPTTSTGLPIWAV
jgi:hypothetical protein